MISQTALVVRTALATVLILSGSFLQSATVSLVPEADTSIFQTDPNFNVGGSQSLASGGTARRGPVRMMLKFDIAGQIPVGATIQDARLDVSVVMAPGGGQPSTFGLHSLLKDWGEGTGGAGSLLGTGRQALNNEATWINRFHPSTPWGQAGGQSGVDFVAGASGTAPVNSLGIATFASTAAMVQDVQTWLDNPASNFGWIGISQSESTTRTARRFGSREIPTASARPTLTLQYELFQFASAQLVPGGFQFTFSGEEGVTYQVENKALLDSSEWLVLTNVGPLTQSGLVEVTDALGDSSRFYRLKRLPRILNQPQAQVVSPGESAQFSVVASGSSNLTYQWRKDGVDIATATDATLVIPAVTDEQLGEYSVVVTDGPDSIESATASLMFKIAPIIVQDPQSITNTVGSTATFTIVLTNNATLPIRYIWRKNFVTPVVTNEVFSRTDTLTITNVQPSDAGGYRVSVSNPVSNALSQEGRLTVIE